MNPAGAPQELFFFYKKKIKKFFKKFFYRGGASPEPLLLNTPGRHLWWLGAAEPRTLKELRISIPFTCWTTLNSGCNAKPWRSWIFLTIDTTRAPSPSIKPPNQNL
uniref:Uncharacterized protein n=1 Tax=Juglanconis sp. TaxID=2041886 RepID=A0A291LI97_9PEZI|nr:hypothetical protein [Juglanconis sp.]